MRPITTLSTEYSLALMSTVLLLRVISSRWNDRSVVTHEPALLPNPLPLAAFVELLALFAAIIPRIPEKAISY